MKKNVLILGSTGMLGNACAQHFINSGNYNVTTTYRNKDVAFPGSAVKFDASADDVSSIEPVYDYIINCIGVIKPFMQQDIVSSIRINSIFPWLLSGWCKQNGMRLFHITTDCVYSGKKGNYIETDLHDALDDYGKSKSLGECSDAMLIRTSIIGEEIHKNASLIAWVKSQKGKQVRGFSNHLWNGITTKQYARICDQIIQNDLYEEGLFHVFASDAVSKYEMLHLFNKKYDLGLTIEEHRPEPVDRTLNSIKPLCEKLNVPTVSQMIQDI